MPARRRRDVEHRFARDGLEHPRSAVRAASRRVGDDARARPAHLGDLVRTGKEAQDARATAAGRIRADIVDVVYLHREDGAVAIERDRHLRLFLPGVRGGDEVLPPVLRPLHRSAERACRERDRGLLATDADLLAEGAADVGHDHAHLVRREAEHAGEVVARGMRALARDPDRHLAARRVPVGDRAARLHGDRDVAVLADGLGDDVRGVVERGAELRIVGRRGGAGDVGVELLVHQLVVLVDRRPEVHHRGVRVVTDVDELAAVLGEGAGLGEHQDDRVADEARLAPRQRSVAERARRQHVGRDERREVVEREYRDDAGQLSCVTHVDVGDRGARVRAAHERGVQHAGDDDVVGVVAAPGEEPGVLLALDTGADEPSGLHFLQP